MNLLKQPCKRSRSARSRQVQGFSMIEWAITCLVVIVALSGVVSSMRGFQARKQLEGVAQNLMADLNLARTASMGAAQAVVLTTASDGGSWRLLRCDARAGCGSGGDTFKVVNLPPEVRLTPNQSFTYQAPRGALQSAAMSVCLSGGQGVPTLKVGVLNALGVATVCGIGGSSGGVAACTSGC